VVGEGLLVGSQRVAVGGDELVRPAHGWRCRRYRAAMTSATDALDRLLAAADSGALEALCDALDLALLVAFGSTTDPDRLHEPRDLDVAVRFRPDARADRVDVINALIDLTGYTEVDVIDLAAAGPVLRARALGPPCEPLYEDHPGGYATAQMAALTEAMETAWLRRLDLELLAER
jgi:predicted nucleotidyltransferase